MRVSKQALKELREMKARRQLVGVDRKYLVLALALGAVMMTLTLRGCIPNVLFGGQ